MSEQTVSKSVHDIPQKIIKEIEDFFSEPSSTEFEHPVFQKVDNVEFIRTYQNKDGVWEEFKVNIIILIRVLNAEIWEYTTVEDDEKRKKDFGKRVKYVMQEANVPWDLAKIAVSRNPINLDNSESRANANALDFIEDVKEALLCYRYFCMRDKISLEEYLREYYRSLRYLTNKQIRIINEYWLAQNA